MSPRKRAGHGTRACYGTGCRRPECVEANRDYLRIWRLNKGMVPNYATRAGIAASRKRLREAERRG